MNFELLGNLGDFIGGLAVIVSLLYLAVQIRQNTKAIRSSSYHQAAEQTWNYCLAVAEDGGLAEILEKHQGGRPLTGAEQIRLLASQQALVFGFENMLRLYEQGLVDRDVWHNLIDNSMPFFGSPIGRQILADRPGPLSRRLLTAVDARLEIQRASGRSPDAS